MHQPFAAAKPEQVVVACNGARIEIHAPGREPRADVSPERPDRGFHRDFEHDVGTQDEEPHSLDEPAGIVGRRDEPERLAVGHDIEQRLDPALRRQPGREPCLVWRQARDILGRLGMQELPRIGARDIDERQIVPAAVASVGHQLPLWWCEGSGFLAHFNYER